MAFLNDDRLVGRNYVSTGSWLQKNSQAELEHKLSENIWRLIILAERSGIDIKKAINDLLIKTEESLLQSSHRVKTVILSMT